MGSLVEDQQRRVIPQWRGSDTTARLGELDSAHQGKAIVENDPFDTTAILEEKDREWRAHRTVSFAEEFVGAAFVLGKPESALAAAAFLAGSLNAPPAAIRIANLVLARPSEPNMSLAEEPAVRVHTARLAVRRDPRNSLAWVDLSREYAALGLSKRSRDAMRVAVALAPVNRFVLRSAARLYVHLDEPERAHNVIVSAPNTASDPWLLASEIAVASVAKIKPLYAKFGFRMLESQRYSAAQTSELASALATIELENGNLKKTRRLFRNALLSPNANSAAQIRWAASQDIGLEFEPAALRVNHAFEARAWQQYFAGDWGNALVDAKAWLQDEPFSSRPAILGSYLASTGLEDFATAVILAEQGRLANPDDPMLLNNLVFCLANLGRVQEASELLRFKSLSLSEEQKAVFLATAGLVEFRSGNVVRGRELYLSAIEQARDLSAKRLMARAAAYLTLEEIKAKTSFVAEASKRVIDLVADFKDDPEIQLIVSRCAREAEKW